LGRTPTAAEVIRRAVAASVARLVRHDPVVRAGEDPEGVHQARVATRRMRSDLRTFAPLVEHGWAQRLRDELRDLAALLGTVRDADVLTGRLREAIATLAPPSAAAAQAFLDDLAAHREEARARLLQAMDDRRYAQLLADLAAAAAQPALLPEAEGPAVELLPPLAAGPWRRLRRRVGRLGKSPADAELHEVRILAKRARYAAEAVAPAAGEAVSSFARAIAGLQDVLGEHQDAVVAEEWLRGAAGRHPEAAFAAGELAATERARASAAREAWLPAWQVVERRRPRGWA
jgi:CHAD domain-containing protein